MSSLQKFHRRTQSGGAASPFTAIGSGDNTNGYWLGTAGDGVSKLIAAPVSSEIASAWGSAGTLRYTTSLTDGITNTNTLVSFGTNAHPAAGVCKYLTTGGYNTWYMPAINEVVTLYNNKSVTPFATSNAFSNASRYESSTENVATNYARCVYFGNGTSTDCLKNISGNYRTRPVRRVI